MKKSLKKGFTIIELVVVMSIILIVTATAVVSYHRMTTQYKEKEYDRIINTFEAAAEAYAAENQDIKDRIYSGAGYATVTLKVLGIEGLIDDEVEDPITGEKFDEKNYVSVYLDENRNFHAVYMKETGSSFTNSREKQSLLAGSYYGRVQMLEYIVGFVRGNYDDATGQYGTKEIDYSQIDIKITDTTDGRVLSNNSIIPTTKEYIDHTFKIEYTFDFGDDGVKKLQRNVSVYNIAPTLKSLTITPDLGETYTNKDLTAMAIGESVHGNVTYHFVVDGTEIASTGNTYVITDNQTVAVYVEDQYGWKSDSLVRTIKNIDKTPPTFDVTLSENQRISAVLKLTNAKDNESGLPVKYVSINKSTLYSTTDTYVAKRNGTYSFTVIDKAGNTTTKELTVSNIIMMNMIGKTVEDVKYYTDKWGIELKVTGSTNKYATVGSQSISEGTPITDGMVLTITMVAPVQSVTIDVTNGFVSGSDYVKSVDKGENATFTVKPSSGYQLSGASVTCDYGAKATLSGETLTVENILQNTSCVVIMKKIPVVYYPPSSDPDEPYTPSCTGCYCSDAAILSCMQANSQAWHSADENTQISLHQQNQQLADALSGTQSFDKPTGVWYDSNGDRLY